MKVVTGTYVSDGERRTVSLGFSPKQVFIKADTTQNLAQRSADIWCARTNVLGNDDSFLDGVAFTKDGFYVGAASEVNSSGVRHYWLAIGDDGSKDFDLVSWLGNGTAGNVISLTVQKTPIAAVIKRDSTAVAAVKFSGVPSLAADGTALSECVSALADGAVTLTAVNNANEYNSAGGLGEGIDGLFLFAGSNVKVVSWSSGASGQFIDCGGDPVAALIFRTDTTGVAGRFLTKDMPPGFAAPITNVALTANEATLASGGIQLGSAATLRTGTFSAIVFCRKDEARAVKAPAIIVRDRKAVYLPGRGTAAQVDCGTSDATLKIDGPISIEWYGIAWPDQYNVNAGVHLLERGVGPAASAGAYSWGLAALQVQDFSWSGPQLAAITTNQWNEVAPLDTAVWRTGILMPWGRPAHIVTVHEGEGRWLMYLNGHLVKQRRLNLATNIVSGAGHRTGFGMRRNTADSAWTQAQRMAIFSGRVYSVALSPSQVASRFVREALRSGESDITSGLAELWDASTASGLLLPAQVSSLNDGSISATARIVTI